MTLSRRHLLSTAAACLVLPRWTTAQQNRVASDLAALESRAGGRLGVGIVNTRTGTVVGHRLDERFAMCSTFKLPLAAVILREADRGRLKLDEVLRYSKADLIAHAPVTTEHLAKGGMTIVALAEATQMTSDNPAANLLLNRLGGPAAFTKLLRETGDMHTRLDRMEPMMNLVLPGEEHDTTTPRAMAHTVARFLAGDLLSASSRDRLAAWMVATRTGDKRIRAGLPPSWRAGDKTGTASADTMTDKINDVAIAWPPGEAPVVITAYYDSNRRSETISDADQAVLADVGRIAAREVR